jgi:ABC-2 type transport system ATP-binding protein
MVNYALEVHGLRVVRGGQAVLEDVELALAPGVLCGLLGPSGAGKTTLMRVLVGVQRYSSGTVTVLGRPAGHPDLRRRVGYVTQDPSVYADLTVRQNLAYFARVLGVDQGDVDRVIDAVDLGRYRDTLVGRLSGGETSRVSLAAALLGAPEVLVLDEPTVGLDPVLRRDLWNLFRELAGRGTTLLVSSHVMDEAARCDRLVLMRAARILADDSLPGLLAATAAPDVESAFLTLVEGAVR